MNTKLSLIATRSIPIRAEYNIIYTEDNLQYIHDTHTNDIYGPYKRVFEPLHLLALFCEKEERREGYDVISNGRKETLYSLNDLINYLNTNMYQLFTFSGEPIGSLSIGLDIQCEAFGKYAKIWVKVRSRIGTENTLDGIYDLYEKRWIIPLGEHIIGVVKTYKDSSILLLLKLKPSIIGWTIQESLAESLSLCKLHNNSCIELYQEHINLSDCHVFEISDSLIGIKNKDGRFSRMIYLGEGSGILAYKSPEYTTGLEMKRLENIESHMLYGRYTRDKESVDTRCLKSSLRQMSLCDIYVINEYNADTLVLTAEELLKYMDKDTINYGLEYTDKTVGLKVRVLSSDYYNMLLVTVSSVVYNTKDIESSEGLNFDKIYDLRYRGALNHINYYGKIETC